MISSEEETTCVSSQENTPAWKGNEQQLLSLSDLDPPNNQLILTASNSEEVTGSDQKSKEKRTPSGNTIFQPISDIKKYFNKNSGQNRSKDGTRALVTCLENSQLGLKGDQVRRPADGELPHFVTPQRSQKKTLTTSKHGNMLPQSGKVNKNKSKRKSLTQEETPPSFDLYTYLKMDQVADKMNEKNGRR